MDREAEGGEGAGGPSCAEREAPFYNVNGRLKRGPLIICTCSTINGEKNFLFRSGGGGGGATAPPAPHLNTYYDVLMVSFISLVILEEIR